MHPQTEDSKVKNEEDGAEDVVRLKNGRFGRWFGGVRTDEEMKQEEIDSDEQPDPGYVVETFNDHIKNEVDQGHSYLAFIEDPSDEGVSEIPASPVSHEGFPCGIQANKSRNQTLIGGTYARPE